MNQPPTPRTSFIVKLSIAIVTAALLTAGTALISRQATKPEQHHSEPPVDRQFVNGAELAGNQRSVRAREGEFGDISPAPADLRENAGGALDATPAPQVTAPAPSLDAVRKEFPNGDAIRPALDPSDTPPTDPSPSTTSSTAAEATQNEGSEDERDTAERDAVQQVDQQAAQLIELTNLPADSSSAPPVSLFEDPCGAANPPPTCPVGTQGRVLGIEAAPPAQFHRIDWVQPGGAYGAQCARQRPQPTPDERLVAIIMTGPVSGSLEVDWRLPSPRDIQTQPIGVQRRGVHVQMSEADATNWERRRQLGYDPGFVALCFTLTQAEYGRVAQGCTFFWEFCASWASFTLNADDGRRLEFGAMWDYSFGKRYDLSPTRITPLTARTIEVEKHFVPYTGGVVRTPLPAEDTSKNQANKMVAAMYAGGVDCASFNPLARNAPRAVSRQFFGTWYTGEGADLAGHLRLAAPQNMAPGEVLKLCMYTLLDYSEFGGDSIVTDVEEADLVAPTTGINEIRLTGASGVTPDAPLVTFVGLNSLTEECNRTKSHPADSLNWTCRVSRGVAGDEPVQVNVDSPGLGSLQHGFRIGTDQGCSSSGCPAPQKHRFEYNPDEWVDLEVAVVPSRTTPVLEPGRMGQRFSADHWTIDPTTRRVPPVDDSAQPLPVQPVLDATSKRAVITGQGATFSAYADRPVTFSGVVRPRYPSGLPPECALEQPISATSTVAVDDRWYETKHPLLRIVVPTIPCSGVEYVPVGELTGPIGEHIGLDGGSTPSWSVFRTPTAGPGWSWEIAARIVSIQGLTSGTVGVFGGRLTLNSPQFDEQGTMIGVRPVANGVGADFQRGWFSSNKCVRIGEEFPLFSGSSIEVVGQRQLIEPTINVHTGGGPCTAGQSLGVVAPTDGQFTPLGLRFISSWFGTTEYRQMLTLSQPDLPIEFIIRRAPE